MDSQFVFRLEDPDLYIPFAAPNANATGAGGGPVFLGPGLNISVTPESLPKPVNLTEARQSVPASGYGNITGPGVPAPTASGSTGNANGGVEVRAAVGAVLGAVLGVVALLA